MSWAEPLLHWLAIHTGTLNEGGPYYGFFSGFGSDLGEVTIIGGAYMIYRKHNCHVDRCWRIAKHPVEGTPYVVCRKHHPTVPEGVSADHIARAHAAATIPPRPRKKATT
jgi:hypothetical protein